MTKTETAVPVQLPRLIETDNFPIEFLSAIAEHESWRKEVHRPIYHLHKWWAIRLGSVFRAILLGCLLPQDADLAEAFYQARDCGRVVVFDPFMGSGTTIGEAHKLGCTALGRDINPIACETARVGFGPLDRNELEQAFANLSARVGPRIRALYQAVDDEGTLGDVLYYFWVKRVPCLHCRVDVDLFSSYVFARNAYPDRKPEVQVYCPNCGGVFRGNNGDEPARCPTCQHSFDPNAAPVDRDRATCLDCKKSFSIIKAVQATGKLPSHRLYAKLVLGPDGKKRYARATVADVAAYVECSTLLQREIVTKAIRLPNAGLSDGYNTRQAIGYNYRNWRDFFNDRQLLALGWLQCGIAQLPEPTTRDALHILFSGVLEFNNMFASYKGEGTGAVRHMFSHHILKPERTPIEANVWGTPKSSGSFTTLFRSRLLRALAYRAEPTEVALQGKGKARFFSVPFAGNATTTWPTDGKFEPRGIYLSCGSSDQTELPDASIDLVITDPPFFDNVHYSQLADFFYAWQVLYPRGFALGGQTTRSEREVQDTDASNFAMKLGAVFTECHRVLKPSGLLVFSYHHSRAEGWSSLAQAIIGAGFSVTHAHPVKAEMSVAAPKTQAKEPIQLDVLLVCRKRAVDYRPVLKTGEAAEVATRRAADKLKRFATSGFTLSQNDRRVVVTSEFMAALGPVATPTQVVKSLEEAGDRLIQIIGNGVVDMKSV